jgi:hypothetical protein
MSTKLTMQTLPIDMLDTITGGYHDPPEPNPAPSSTPGCPVGESHPKSLEQKLGDLGKRIGPWIQMFSR